jgi:hypothetical protein
MAKNDKDDVAKRFSVSKGEKGLLMIADASGNARQATAFTREGDVLRFSLAGDGGAFYSVKQGDPEFDDLAEAFEANGVSAELDPAPAVEQSKAAARSETKTPAAQG